MKINKSLDIDLNIISPQKHIRIHEGDVDSVDILIGVTVDDESVDLSGVTIKYDATINNYLAEQDANGSVVDDKISIPVTQNMTAMSGLLLIDVRMIQNDQILFTQTICATVEKAVVNGSTYIDFDKITIIQRMNALEEKMDYIEELVENFDTSKLIVSVNRPPEGAPAEVDVDLLRVGDTWILSGANIVYKLVEAQYNYQPVPSAEPYHKFIWQPLNERYGVGNTEPPTTVTYQAVVYTINEVQWSWLPVPEYFQGDHYQILVSGESTYYVCKSGTMATTGVCTYTWREEGEGLAKKMDLIPTDPTAEQITAMLNGQLYGDTVNHKGIIKGGQEFYDTVSLKGRIIKKVLDDLPPKFEDIAVEPQYEIGDIVFTTYFVVLSGVYIPFKRFWQLIAITDGSGPLRLFDWKPLNTVTIKGVDPTSSEYIGDVLHPCPYQVGDVFEYYYNNQHYWKVFIITKADVAGNRYRISCEELTTKASLDINFYNKPEINSMIGDIETALSEV